MKASCIFRSPLNWLKEWLKEAVARRLSQEVATYEVTAPNNMARLYKHIRKGDVVLVEGMLRISTLIKYTTQSLWSHCSLYVGDELLRRGGPLREQALASFGDFANRLVIEAPPYNYPLTMRHYSQILPQDFDLSPNFQVIKFNIIEDVKGHPIFPGYGHRKFPTLPSPRPPSGGQP